MYKYLCFVALIFISSSAQSDVFSVEDPKRTVRMIGVVDGRAMALAKQIEKLSRTREPIDMLINSPGGSMEVGMVIVDAMRLAKKRGVKFRCASAVMAASMAFIMLAECQERYVLANTRLLFHPVSISGGGIRIQELIVGLHETIDEERAIMADLQKVMKLRWKDFHRHYFAETFWAGYRLAKFTTRARFLRVVDDMYGWGDDLFTYRKPQLFILGGQLKTHESETVKSILKRFEGGE